MDQKFMAEVMAFAGIIDDFDYYQVLKVQPNASLNQIRASYHAQSRVFHPDRYFHYPDGEFKQNVYKISKRITEAYVTLRDPQARGFYDKQLVDTNRQQLRYTEQSKQAQKKSKTEDIGKTDKGRQLYQQGMMNMKRKKFADAERDFKMAMVYEPENELFKKMAQEASDSIKTDFSVK
jgi:curved DNA-binding protein CbpA